MERRALIAEERAAEAVLVERKVHAALDAREKQMASMRLRVSQCLLLSSSSTPVKGLRNVYSTIRANSSRPLL